MHMLCRSSSPVSYGHDIVASRGSQRDEWNADLLGCCSEPALCRSMYLIFVQQKTFIIMLLFALFSLVISLWYFTCFFLLILSRTTQFMLFLHKLLPLYLHFVIT
uniref:Uncharacterized protein n=1 Tax=Arundo donax TaxID=35708 RepID=A0A0A9DRY4_ARUDO